MFCLLKQKTKNMIISIIELGNQELNLHCPTSMQPGADNLLALRSVILI